MRNRGTMILIGAAAALLSACQPAERPVGGTASAAGTGASPSPPSGRGDAPDIAPVRLAGEFRVAAIDGSEVTGGIGLALTVTDKLIWFDPRCAGFNWTYTLADDRLTTDRPQKPRAAGAPYVAGPMGPVCKIAVHPEQQRLATALDAVTHVRRTLSNGIELHGGGHSVTLYSQ